jgi:hypothetical protein
MNEAIIEDYIVVLEGREPEYMTEGLREFIAKFDKNMFKRSADKIYQAFSKGDGEAFDDVAKKTAKIGKIPKFKEVSTFMAKFKEDHPEIDKSIDLTKKVLRNTFKVRDKAKLEIMSNLVGMTALVKSKGGRIDPLKITKTTLQQISSDVNSVYDTGFENMETNTTEEEKAKSIMIKNAKKQEKVEMVLVSIILALFAGAIVWAGIALWSFFTSPYIIAAAAVMTLGVMLLKLLAWGVGIATIIIIPTITYLKATGRV